MNKILSALTILFFGVFLPFCFFVLGGVAAHLVKTSAYYETPADLHPALAVDYESIVQPVFVEPIPVLTSVPDVFVHRNLLSFIFVGDIMLDRGVENSVINHGKSDFSFLFKNSGFLKGADITFGNLEGPLAEIGSDRGNLYSFKFNPEAMIALTEAGFDALSVANNHMADWGLEAFRETVFRLKNAGIAPVGGGMDFEDAASPRIVVKNGTRIGFLGFSNVGPPGFGADKTSPGIVLIDDNFDVLIKTAAKVCDLLIVSIHFGEEYEPAANEHQKFLAKSAVDSGAKIVIGHHPHVIQEVEHYNGGLIAYSLGNFIFDQNFSDETMEGLVLEVMWQDGQFIAVKENKIKINNLFQPQLVE